MWNFGIYSSSELTVSDLSLVDASKKYLNHRPDQFNLYKINNNLIFHIQGYLL